MITINSVFNIILLVSQKAELASQTKATWEQVNASWVQAVVAIITGVYVIFEIHNYINKRQNNIHIHFTYKFIKGNKNNNVDKIVFTNKSGSYANGYIYLFNPRYMACKSWVPLAFISTYFLVGYILSKVDKHAFYINKVKNVNLHQRCLKVYRRDNIKDLRLSDNKMSEIIQINSDYNKRPRNKFNDYVLIPYILFYLKNFPHVTVHAFLINSNKYE